MEKEELINSIHREVKVQESKPKEKKKGQRTTSQYSIQIPKEIILALGIKKGDKVVMDVNLKTKDYTIKFSRKK